MWKGNARVGPCGSARVRWRGPVRDRTRVAGAERQAMGLRRVPATGPGAARGVRTSEHRPNWNVRGHWGASAE
jgi:hypothetical protein